jgi:phage/plasmid-associated DNA primase
MIYRTQGQKCASNVLENDSLIEFCLPTFYFVNYSKQIFSANTIPKTPDETDAFFARQIIINFPNQFFGDNIDYYIIDKLTTAEELSSLLI